MACARENRFDLAHGLAAMKVRIPLLALLVMLTLLVCHAAVGSTNRLALEPAPAAVPHQLFEVAGTSAGHSVERSSAHTYYYVAALCTLLLGSFVGLFLVGGARRRGRAALLRRAGRRFVPDLLYSGARPTPPLLQVFRL